MLKIYTHFHIFIYDVVYMLDIRVWIGMMSGINALSWETVGSVPETVGSQPPGRERIIKKKFGTRQLIFFNAQQSLE